MASSSYYKRKYHEARDEKNYYKARRDDIGDIVKSLEKDYEISSANGKMAKCRDKLIDGMEGSSEYQQNAKSAYNSQRLRDPEIDYELSTAHGKLQREYARLEERRSDAEYDEDRYYDLYKAALRAEREAAKG